ncbi:S41 family peptidase [Dysgonomonas sp. 511]|uniref:S41 family peptidase n=1 Tax=Dysgonomonas sp. 511 TaxID=2302930 RepID=UPI0013D4B19F|nr:S41 family peptidase [Dysgonomonas sp. 511]NDV78422.1 hypothetical protein [Dysgonomonas sp. 511]
MKAKLFFLLSMTILLVLLYSCEDKDSDGGRGNTNNEYVNKWVYENMDFYYYWRDKMPSYASLDKNLAPKNFFEKLKFAYNTSTYDGDRFSWIQESYVDLLNSLSGVSSKEIGFEYIPYMRAETGSEAEFVVVYVKKGTKAESSGLKRGDIIWKVDGVDLTESNWSAALYQNKSSYRLEGPNFDGVITVEPTGTYAENPIYLDRTYNIAGYNTPIGYIVYNQFTMDNGDGSYSYDKQINSIFSRFESEGVKDVILDLRYNGGGYVSCVVNIGSALVPNRNTSNVFFYKDYNSVFDAYAKEELGSDYDTFVNDYFKDNIEMLNSRGKVTIADRIPNFGDKINKLYILVGANSASASELIINGLIPYMSDKMVLIGATTYGKNVGSVTLYRENDNRNKWGIQPIVSRSYNSDDDSEYGGGFTPGKQVQGALVNEFAGIMENGLKPLGDENETLLAYALSMITGKAKSATLKSAAALPPARQIGSSFGLKPGAYDMVINDNKVQQLIDSQF